VSGDKKRILAVDDEEPIRSMLESALRNAYDVRTCPSGQDILQELQKHRPDLIIMDIMMPGIDGLQTTHILRQDERFKEIPVLFLTALGEPQAYLQSLRVGGDGYLVKPFALQDLLTRIKELLM